MRSLPFKAKFDLIVSAFDSINYLTNKKDLSDFFDNLKNNLSDDGIFTFDISLESNSLKYVKNLNRTGYYKGIEYMQTSRYNRHERTHYNEFKLKLKDGSEVYEKHKQKIYSLESFFDLLDKNGYIVKECFTAFSLDNAHENSERAQFIIKKGKNALV
jgi:cyclopropane fatty-acyl-phospholipid synthase-like methyltransferase